MAHRRNSSLVATYADHEVITPANELRKAITRGGPDEDDPVARAEAAVAELSSQFTTWMQAECERLETARRDVKRLGFTEETRQLVFRVAHDIKGEASTFGFAEVCGVAESLCRLLEHTPDLAIIPMALVDQHVDAVRAIVREHAHTDAAPLATALTRRLRDVTDEFLQRENSFRPDYLEIIFAPPLAPKG